jgi:hypothetical protein
VTELSEAVSKEDRIMVITKMVKKKKKVKLSL